MLNFHTDDTLTWSVSEQELLAAIRWRRKKGSAAANVAAKSVDAFAKWLGDTSSMQTWTTKGDMPHPLWQVLWSAEAFPVTGRSRTVAGVIEHFAANTAKRTRSEMLRMLLNEFDGERPADPFELLGLLVLLQTKRTELPENLRVSLFRVALLSARDFAVEIDATPPGVEPADNHLLRRGELPLLVGRVFDSVQGSTHLRRGGEQTLIQLMDEETDTDGTPHGRMLSRLPWFLASLTRAKLSQPETGRATWNAENQKRFASLVRESVLLAGRDGKFALAESNVTNPASLLHASIEAAGLPTRDPARRAMAATRSEFAAKPKRTAKDQPKFSVASAQSEWGGLATFRGDFASPKVKMVVDFHGQCPRIAIHAGGHAIVAGEWDVETTVEGETLPQPDGWSSVCWYSDDEADYLELQATLPGDIQLTRHFIYAHDDAVLVLAASVRNVGNKVVKSIVRLPVPDNVKTAVDDDDRLIHLRKPVPVRVIPLGLEPDRFRSTSGDVRLTEAGIEVEQVNPTDGLCIPVAFDLDPKAKDRRQLEWQRLTVAQDGRVISKGRGDAWRFRVGYHEDSPQWVYYQGLSECSTSRTIIGMHTTYEMIFGRFEEGEIDPLVHVETEE